jgi:phosphinothricin acetyltransferase
MSAAIRPATVADLAAITEIYNHYVVNTAITFDLEPFEVEDRREWFEHYSDVGPHRVLVAEHEGKVVGYATSGGFRDKPAYAPSVEVTIYLATDAGGRGIGRALYTRLFDEIGGEDLHRAYAAIALPNDASIGLHRSLGFVEVGTMTEVGRKFDQWWDVLWMQRPLP